MPPYPEPNGTQSFNETTEIPPVEKKEEIAIDVKQLSYDLVEMGFKMWHVVNPRVRELEDKECQNISTPLAHVIDKYDLTKYMKYAGYTQEILLVYNLGSAIVIRTKELKKPVETGNPFKDGEVDD